MESRYGKGRQNTSGQSVRNLANVVKYTSQLPGGWTTLATINGNSQWPTVTDQPATASRRYYRVRIQY